MSTKFKPKDVVGLLSHPDYRMTVIRTSETNSTVYLAYFDANGQLTRDEIPGEALVSAEELDSILEELNRRDHLKVAQLRRDLEDEDE